MSSCSSDCLHWPDWYVCLAVLFIAALLLAILSQAFVSAWSVGWAVLLFGPILLLTVYVHELGHCLASRAVGHIFAPVWVQTQVLPTVCLCVRELSAQQKSGAGGC
jgi:hypothetical protein